MKKPLATILTVALILAFAVFALGSGESEGTADPKDTKAQEPAASEKAAATEPAASEKAAATEKNSQNQRQEVRVGETLNVNDLKITYDSAEKWTSDNMFIQPADGKQFIRLHFSIANDMKSDQYVGAANFECYADGAKCKMQYTGDDILSSGSLSSGRKISGYVYYEVPVNATSIEVEYETSFWTNKKAYFIVQF